MNTRQSSVTDEPFLSSTGDSDGLGISIYADALTEFVTTTNTPMTIGIQGDWGSGKTSLLNIIEKTLSQSDKYFIVWVNSWEHSLLSSPEETLMKILQDIISQVLKADPNSNKFDKLKKYSTALARGVLQAGSTIALGIQASDKLSEAADSVFGDSNPIRSLRGQFTSAVEEIQTRKTNPVNRIVIFVDDLDRIDPGDAVRVMELLKNVLTVRGCVFVLAIDYGVVIKGLKEKFGEMTEENEWEFRAFFDKLIQLPFRMPITSYDLEKYVGQLLEGIDFQISRAAGFHDELANVIQYSIGPNPRAIKRLINSVSLIRMVIQQTEGAIVMENIDKALLVSLLCIQVQYPRIEQLLKLKPNFVEWNTDFVLSVISTPFVPPDLEEELNVLKHSEDFDEEWEQAVYRFCHIYPEMRTKATTISRCLSGLQELLQEGGKDNTLAITEMLEMIKLTSTGSQLKRAQHLSQRD